jgi:hypothetical protein
MPNPEKKMVTPILPQFDVIDYGDTVFLLGMIPEGTKPDEVNVTDRDTHKGDVQVVGLDRLLRAATLTS